MKIILAHCGNGYSGCYSEEAFFFDQDSTEDDINCVVWIWVCENAEYFAHAHFGWDEEYTDEEWEDYIENYVEFDWHEATREEYVEWCRDYLCAEPSEI